MGADCLQSQWEEPELFVFPLEWSLLKQSSGTLRKEIDPTMCKSDDEYVLVYIITAYLLLRLPVSGVVP